MAIGNYIQSTITQIQSQRNADIERAKQKAHQEKIVPFNTEIESSKQKAINELTQQFQAQVSELQQKFQTKTSELKETLEAQKKEICDASDKKKADFAQATLISAETEVAVAYDKVLADLAKIAEYTDKQ